ncbi:MAG: YncE family protein [Streptosporangiaceae bacterium]
MANDTSDTVTPIVTATGAPLKPITVGRFPDAIVISPDGKTLYVQGPAGTVMPISTATSAAGPPIPGTSGAGQLSMAISPNGKTLIAGDFEQGAVTVINLATRHASPPIPLAGGTPFQIAVSPDSARAYVATGNVVTPIRPASGQALRAIPTGPGDFAIAITPDGTLAYTANYTSGTATAIRIPAGSPRH